MGKRIYAAYRAGKNIGDGTAEELAEKLGVEVSTIRKLATPSYHTGCHHRGLVIIKLEKEDINYG